MNAIPSVLPAGWIREHSTVLTTIDPSADLADLEPLREIVGDARVAAIGENAHFVEEFSTIRQRVLRFLAERCGFSVFAFEFSFAGAGVLDRWLAGQDGRTLGEVSPAAADWGAGGLLAWLREHNTTSGNPLRFVGIDIPDAGGALRPVLEPLADYLAIADPDSAPLVETALRISDSFLAGLRSGASAAPAWARLDAAQQNELTAVLARLQLRLRAIQPLVEARGDAHSYAVAERLVAGACAVDYMFRAMNDLYSGTGRTADLSTRDIYMAETLRWQLEHAPPGARIVLAAHNNHIQKTANVFGPATTALPMGQHLARMLGNDYVAIGLTHTDGHVPEMHPDPAAPVGFTLGDEDLPEPQPGSIEAALVGAGLREQITFTDLRRAPTAPDGSPLLTDIRTQSAVTHTPLGDAFDAVIATPTVTRDRTVTF
ncbi:erythromycin esterase family protein [Pseudofrankia sp. BMG5.36]|uniref:erythromycin esterase family protein n=1 Tax=Pseudofrankia sp. BMG5.36 TaxID=1834512 RepID=UPI000B1E0929|nr:erythromycin esterase family protein [Pseudofrankia sp. BMG5.36]